MALDTKAELDPIEAEIEAEKERIAQLAAEREAASAPARKKAQLEQLRRERSFAEALPALEAKYGPLGNSAAAGLARVDLAGGIVVVKRPSKEHFRKYADLGKTDSEALTELVKPCIVYPLTESGEVDKAAAWALIDGEGFGLTRVANAVAQLGGVRVREVTGKP
jgi:hypothetical protein